MFRLLKSIFLISFLSFFFSVCAFAEDITITTYYPSPSGSYSSLQADKLGVGDNNADGSWTAADVPVNAGEVWIKGNVGVGTMAPREKIDVVSTLRVGTDGKLTIYSASGGSCPGCGTENVSLQTTIDNRTVSDGLPFDAASRHTLSLQPTYGNVGIGTTSPSYQLQLSADSAAKPTTNTWTVASDERIKRNISDFSDGLDTIMKLKPRTYQYNGLGGKGYDDTNTHIGFIAQEVELIAPYMVETSKGIIGGAQVSDFKNYQGHALPFILVNAIQEQQGIIKAQQLQIDGLKVRLDKLEKDKSK